MAQPTTFLEPDTALRIILSHAHPRDIELCPLPECLNRTLAETIRATRDEPRFRKAAMDGYAVGPNQSDRPFEVVGAIAAGDSRDPDEPAALKENEGVRIMTGAVVPPDIERVIRFECTEPVPKDGRRPNAPTTAEPRERVRDTVLERNTNIVERGENLHLDDPLLSPRRLSAVDLGVLASQGHWKIPVLRRPSVGVISTGSELVSPEEPDLPAYAIYNSNGYLLEAMVREHHATVHNYGIVRDDQQHITETIRTAAEEHDIVICSGGVSMGDLDFVPAALDALGAETLFHGLAMKPGRPTLFAMLGSTLMFGLPGNPVSTWVQCEMFLVPALYAMQSLTYHPREAELPLAQPFSRSKADRHEWVPGYYRAGAIHTIEYHGSGHISALAAATLVFRVNRGVTDLSAGETVYARFIRPEDQLSPDIGY
ncbi:MAG: molybdopterin molybdotransferase MoeA [Alkalispirochaeta sp.]